MNFQLLIKAKLKLFFESSYILSKEERGFVADQDMGCQGCQTDIQTKTLTDPRGWGHPDKFIKRNRVFFLISHVTHIKHAFFRFVLYLF